jgi:2-keto-3-deoxy-L-rhamnonate aldolase RhmA
MENGFRRLLCRGKSTIGTHLSSTWPTLWEVVGSTGQFDYIEFDSQDGAWDLHDLDNMCRAAELTKTGTMIKIDRNPKDWIAKRAIAAGFEAVLFADIMTAKEAKECVQAVRLPPEGVNSFLGTRGIPMDDRAKIEDYAQRIDDIVIAIMAERSTLVDELDEVLAIDGLDMIQFGQVDYGLSLRTPRKPFRFDDFKDKIQADFDKVNEMAISAGIRPRVETGDAESCQYFLDRGIRDFCIGWDVDTVRRWCMKHGKKLRDMLLST